MAQAWNKEGIRCMKHVRFVSKAMPMRAQTTDDTTDKITWESFWSWWVFSFDAVITVINAYDTKAG